MILPETNVAVTRAEVNAKPYLQLTGSDKKRQIVVSFDSIVDYFTIPSVLLGVVLNRYFTGRLITVISVQTSYFTGIVPSGVDAFCLRFQLSGFSFFRAQNFKWLVEILAYRRIIKSTSVVRLIKLIVLVLSLIMIAAGLLHLVRANFPFTPTSSGVREFVV